MENKKRKIIIIVLFVFVLYIVYNLIWYFGCYRIYLNYQNGFPEIADSGMKIYVDEDGYNYSVKLPSYLSWVGNLSATEENTDYALIIWPGVFGSDSDTGIILTSESKQCQVELKNKVTAVDSAYQKLVNDNLEIIALLYDKANDVWSLELE